MLGGSLPVIQPEPDPIMTLRPLKTWIRNTARALGYDILPLRDMKDRDFSIHLGQLFRFLEIDCVLDVGANTGQYHDFLRDKVGYRGLIVSVEPVRHNIEILQSRRADDSRWDILGYALGRAESTLPIHVMKSDQFSSFLTPDNSAVPSFDGLNEAAHTETVPVRRLDDVLPVLQQRHGFRNIYLKLDTQGFDLEVLAGAQASLPGIKALQTEASIIGIYKDMPDYVETIRVLNQRGFDISGLYPISRDPGMRLIEFDCVMINRAVVATDTAARHAA
jgi:FkbM family methyltransferase